MPDSLYDVANQAFVDSEWDPERVHQSVRVPRYHYYFLAPELSSLTASFWKLWRPFRFARGWATKFLAIERARDAGLLSKYGVEFARGWVLARPRDPRLPPIAFSQKETSISSDGTEVITVVTPHISVQLPHEITPAGAVLERLVIFQRIVRIDDHPIQVAMCRLDIVTGKFTTPTASDVELGERARLAFAISAGLPVSADWKTCGAKAPRRLARLIASQHPEDLGVPGPWTRESLAAFLVVSGIAPPELAMEISSQIIARKDR
jgi:hypothetical protein